MIKSKEITLVGINEIKTNPLNPNVHSDEQIQKLCELIAYQGFRSPLIISNRCGLLIAGHGRLEAAKMLGFEQLPVIFQDFDSEEQEYTSMISDNAVATWAQLDLSKINTQMGDMGPFDTNLLAIPDFDATPSYDANLNELPTDEIEINEKEVDENISTEKECPSCGYKYS